MPNWCHNTLTISGSKEKVDSFIKENQGNVSEGESLLFSKTVPEPNYEGYTDGSTKTTEDGLPTWFNWRLENWGTKWEPNIESDIEINILETATKTVQTATYYFDTAWGPAITWFEKAVEKYPEIKFCLIYGEVGSDFGGAMVASQGKIISDLEGSAAEYLPEEMMWF